jgi:outer membrane protein assembly factor BamB
MGCSDPPKEEPAASLDAVADEGLAETSIDASEIADVGDAAADARVVYDAAPVNKGCDFFGGVDRDAPWPMPGRCPSHAGLAAVNGATTFTKKWMSEALVAGHVAVTADGSIVGATSDGLIVLAADGTKKWEAKEIGAVSSVTLGADGLIYAATAAKRLLSFTATGSVKFLSGTTTVANGPVINTDGVIFFTTPDGLLTAHRPAGTVLWSLGIAAPVDMATPALTKTGMLYVSAGGVRNANGFDLP